MTTPTITLDANAASPVTARGWTATEADFALSATPVVTVVEPGSCTPAVIGDATWNVQTGATIDTTAVVAASALGTSFSSLDTAVATVDPSSGIVSRVADGSARIVGQSPRQGKLVSVAVSHVEGASTSSFVEYNSGSLASTVLDFLASALVDREKPLLSVANHDAGIYQWNPNNWAVASGMDVTPFSIWHSIAINRGCLLPIHPQICVLAAHYGAMRANGATVRWLTTDNQTVTRTTTSGYLTVAGDLALIRLDSPLPSEIGLARVMPTDWRDFLTTIYSDSGATAVRAMGVPVFCKDQDYSALLLDWFLSNTGEQMFSDAPDDPLRAPYFKTLVTGDSSNDFCLIQPALKYFVVLAPVQGPTIGSSLSGNRAALLSAMDTLVPGALPIEADFSAYTL